MRNVSSIRDDNEEQLIIVSLSMLSLAKEKKVLVVETNLVSSFASSLVGQMEPPWAS